MRNTTRFLCCFSSLLVLAVSCGKQEPAVRDKSFLAVEEALKISDLMHGAVVRSPKGRFFMTAFIHSVFPSATEAREAIAVFESNDDGATWEEISRIPSFITNGVWGYDLIVDGNEGLYVTWVAAIYGEASPSPFKAIMFSRSHDGGRSWTEPIYVSDVETGQRWQPVMAVSGRHVYIAWLDGRGGGPGAPGRSTQQDVYLASSGDRGATWSANAILEKALDRKDSSSGMPSICVGADGDVYCAYFSMRKPEGKKKGGSGHWIAKSVDKGETFNIGLHDVGPLGAVTIAEGNGKLYLAAAYLRGIKSISLADPQTYQEIRLYVSSDGGESWDKPVMIDDDPDHRHKANLKLVSLGGGRLAACWDDERGGVYMAASAGKGNGWGKNIKVAEKSHVGNTPLDIAADTSTGSFAVLASDIRKGGGDAVFLVRGQIVP